MKRASRACRPRMEATPVHKAATEERACPSAAEGRRRVLRASSVARCAGTSRTWHTTGTSCTGPASLPAWLSLPCSAPVTAGRRPRSGGARRRTARYRVWKHAPATLSARVTAFRSVICRRLPESCISAEARYPPSRTTSSLRSVISSMANRRPSRPSPESRVPP
jgi:hypothetical protein